MCPPRFERPPLVGRAVTEAGTLPGGPQSLPGAGDTRGESCRGRGLSQEWGRGSIPTSPVAAPHPAGDRQTPSQPAEFRGQSTDEETEALSAREASPNTRDGKSWSPVGLAVMPMQAGWRPELLPPLRTLPPGRPLCDLWEGSPASPLWGVTPFPHLVSPLASDTTKEPPPFRGRKRGCRVRRPSELRRWPSPCSLRPRAGPSADGLSHPKIHGRG